MLHSNSQWICAGILRAAIFAHQMCVLRTGKVLRRTTAVNVFDDIPESVVSTHMPGLAR
jgi:hypothetical protein